MNFVFNVKSNIRVQKFFNLKILIALHFIFKSIIHLELIWHNIWVLVGLYFPPDDSYFRTLSSVWQYWEVVEHFKGRAQWDLESYWWYSLRVVGVVLMELHACSVSLYNHVIFLSTLLLWSSWIPCSMRSSSRPSTCQYQVLGTPEEKYTVKFY